MTDQMGESNRKRVVTDQMGECNCKRMISDQTRESYYKIKPSEELKQRILALEEEDKREHSQAHNKVNGYWKRGLALVASALVVVGIGVTAVPKLEKENDSMILIQGTNVLNQGEYLQSRQVNVQTDQEIESRKIQDSHRNELQRSEEDIRVQHSTEETELVEVQIDSRTPVTIHVDQGFLLQYDESIDEWINLGQVADFDKQVKLGWSVTSITKNRVGIMSILESQQETRYRLSKESQGYLLKQLD